MSKKTYKTDLSKYKSFVEEPKIESIEEQPIEVVEELPIEIPQPEKLYTVQIVHPSLRRRTIPSVNGVVLGLITDLGQYDIFEEVNGWGKLKDNSWIMLQYTEKVNE